MGTYEQPGQVLDNSIGELSKGFAAMTAGLGAGLMQRNAAKLKAAKNNTKTDTKWIKDIEKLRANFVNKDYPSGGIVDEKYQEFIEENLQYLYDKGREWGVDSREYQTLYNRTKELALNSATSVGLINKSNEQFLGGYTKPNGGQEAKIKNLNQDGAFLNNPSSVNTLQFQYDWTQNEGAHSSFFRTYDENGQIEDYGINYEHLDTDDAGETILRKDPLSFRSYPSDTDAGFGKFQTLDRKQSLGKFNQMWNTLGKGIEERWKPTVDKEETKTDGKKILEKSINADLYTEKLEEAYLDEDNFDRNWGEITQNDWQTYGFDSHYTGTALITLADGTTMTEKEAFQRAVLDQTYKEHGYVNKLTREEQDLATSALDTRVANMKSGQTIIPGLPTSVGGGTTAFVGLGLTTKAGIPFEDAQEFVYEDYVTLANEISSVQQRGELAKILSQMAAGNGKNYSYKTSSDIVEEYKNQYQNSFPTPGTTYEDAQGKEHTFGHAGVGANDADKMEFLRNSVFVNEDGSSYYDPGQLLKGPTDKLYRQTGTGRPKEVKIDASQGSLNQQAVLNLMLKETGLIPLEKRALQQSGTSAPSGGGIQRKKTTTTVGELPTAIKPEIQQMIDEEASNEELLEAITGQVDQLTDIQANPVVTPTSSGATPNPGQLQWHQNQARQTQYGNHFAATGGLAHHDDDGYYFGDRTIKESDFVNPPIDTKTFKGQGYIADMFNRESSLGNADGTGLDNYGFTGTRFKQNGMTPPETPEEALALVNKEIIGDPKTKTKAYKKNGKPKEEPSILYELNHIGGGIKLNNKQWSELEKDNPMVAKILVDYKFNTGRSVKDLITIAAGGDWDGKRAAGPNVKDATVLKAIDNPAMRQKYDAYKKAHKGKDMDYTLWFLTNGLDVTKMLDAREDLYTKGSKFNQTAWDKSQKNRI